ncbi:MAG: hypothetical protein HC783_15385 [Rhodobacteraceae bacterium]|nr:hypothetical protein [Paracoccaceae bacterium]
MKGLRNVTGFDFIGRTPDAKKLLVAALTLNSHGTEFYLQNKRAGMSLDVYAVDAATGEITTTWEIKR